MRQIAFLSLVLLLPAAAVAQTLQGDTPQLQQCLKRADDLPDIAAAETTAWIKKGGGNDARLCHAFAQANRGMHLDAARDFWALASAFTKTDLHKALLMHNQSGQEFLRGKDTANAEAQYSAALKIQPDAPDSLIGRATVRQSVERYWDALDDLNRAVKTAPASAQALRLRGRVWAQLGNDRKAQEDFDRADSLAPLPQ